MAISCPISDSISSTGYSDPGATYTLNPPQAAPRVAPPAYYDDGTTPTPPGPVPIPAVCGIPSVQNTVVNGAGTPVVTEVYTPPPVVPPEVRLDTVVHWLGNWVAGQAYVNNDLVFHVGSGNAYICAVSHTSTLSDEPFATTGGDFFWEKASQISTGTGLALSMPPTPGTFMDNLVNGALDWMKNAEIGDWLGAAAIGAGVVVAGTEILDMFAATGTGAADSSMHGPAGLSLSDFVEIDENTIIYESGSQPATPELNALWYNSGTEVWKKWSGSIWVTILAPANLRAMVKSVCVRAGIANYDVSLLPLRSCNVTIANVQAARDLLQLLSLAYQFDIVDSAGCLKFVPRSATVVKTLTLDDLGYSASSDVPPPYVSKRFQGIDLPRSITLNYSSKAMDFSTFSQISTLETYTAGQDVKIDVPVTLTEGEAKLITDSTLVNAHMERMNYTFTTSYEQLELEPGDIIDTPMGTLRIIAQEEHDEGILTFNLCDAGYSALPTPIYAGQTLIGYTASTFIGTGMAPAIPPAINNVATVLGFSQGLFLDLPVLSSDDQEARGYVAMHGFGAAGWPGAALYRSKDNGATFTQIASTTTEATIGLVATAVPTTTNFSTFDDVSVITVQMKTGTLGSKTDLQLQNGDNLCMIGQELLQFGVATLTAPGTYQLSHLKRGEKGTEAFASTHGVNELFALVDQNLVRIPLTTTERNTAIQYKVITLGSDLSKASTQTITFTSMNLIPWKVTAPTAVKVGNDFNINWTERPRFVTTGHDPDWTGYVVIVYGPLDVVKRTTIVQTESFKYTLAMQTADFGSARSVIKVNVIALSKWTGYGQPSIINS